MFNSSLTTIPFFLWITWAVFLIGGGLIGKPDIERTRRMPRWIRMASSLVLVIAAWSYALLYREQVFADTVVLIAIGMSLCFIGDLFMAQLLLRDERHILAGIGSFGLGHVAYIAAFIRLLNWPMANLANEPRINSPQPSVNAFILIGCWLLAAIVWYRLIYHNASKRTVLHLAALPYALLLATTLGAGLNFTLYILDVSVVANTDQAIRAIIPTLGALLFFISDFILAVRLFNKVHFHMIDDWVWLTYGPGQMLIVYGVGLLLMH